MKLMVLEYLKVVLSAPVIAGGVGLAFLIIFREAIRALMSRIASIRFPGGGELVATSQAGQETREVAPSTKAEPVPADRGPAPISLTAEQVRDIQNELIGERINARLWEYRYLNFFLVWRTKTVLDWLATSPEPLPLSLVDSNLMAFIPEAGERSAIIHALQTHHLIDLRGTLVEVTPKGREYLQWRGPLPPPAPTSPKPPGA